MEVTLELAARMAVLGGMARESAEGRRLCERTLKSGKPQELFLRNVKSQGGDPARLLETRGKYRSPVTAEIRAAKDAYISRIDAWKTGHASVLLGVGRNRTEDKVCPTAGIQFHHKRGSRVKAGDRIMTVWAADEAGLTAALPALAEAVEYSETPPPPRKLILKEIL
jgi:pyrimidine-nucleoside phosphorylase